MLQRIEEGGDVTFDDIFQKVSWEVPSELDPLLQEIYQQLQMFGSDQDLRSRDREYDLMWREKMHAYLRRLERLQLV